MSCTSNQLSDVEQASQPLYLFIQIVQILLCVFAPFLFFHLMSAYRKVYLHENIRVLLKFYQLTVIFYCLSFAIIESYHVISRLFLSKCDLLVPIRTCIWFRIVQSWASVVFQFFYIAVTIEIGLRQLFKPLEKSKWIPRFLGMIVFIVSYFAVVDSLRSDMMADGYLANCASLENKTKAALNRIFIAYLAFDFVSLLTFVFLRIYIECYFSESRTKYNVNLSIERKELRRVYKMMLPNIVLHVICYTYIGLSSIIAFTRVESFEDHQIQFLISNAVPVYVFISPLVWCYVLHRQRQNLPIVGVSQEKDIYFGELAKQWSLPLASYESEKPRRNRVSIEKSII